MNYKKNESDIDMIVLIKTVIQLNAYLKNTRLINQLHFNDCVTNVVFDPPMTIINFIRADFVSLITCYIYQ